MKTYSSINRQIQRQSGFSMFEVLIAIAVTSIGLFGLAGIQAAGLVNNQSAYQRSQATVLAYDIADRMRANFGADPEPDTLAPYLTSSMTLIEAKNLGAQDGCITTSGCTVAEMAQNDLYEWNEALTAAIPGATGTITVDNRGTADVPEDDIYTIVVAWDDDRNGEINDDDPDFSMSFVPGDPRS